MGFGGNGYLHSSYLLHLEVNFKSRFYLFQFYALHSKVFHAMLFNKEAKPQTRFVLEGLKYEQLVKLHNALSPDVEAKVDEDNVQDLLFVSKKYQINSFANRCENYLLDDEMLATEKKLLWSEMYGLESLQVRMLLYCYSRGEKFV